ncbi:unnamed protein product [Soboliphyme baturini]|uniref:Protein MIX23 n=1 Tax=Soboliphyme baturini TaxID=241478 RepID=A0A183IEG5_9BILA|nr:unnamed protein product [Soboliphyme baturini]
MSAYKARSAAINKCLVEVQNQVEHYRHIKDENPDDIGLLKKLKNEQYKLRLMQNEVNVEEVLKDRSLKVFKKLIYTFLSIMFGVSGVLRTL